MKTTRTANCPSMLAFALLLLPVTGLAESKTYVCSHECTTEGNCETCVTYYCREDEREKNKDKISPVRKKTEKTCEVEETAASLPVPRFKLDRTGGESAGATRFGGKQAAVLQDQASTTARTVSRPTVDGRLKTPSTYDAAVATPDRWRIGPGNAGVPRRFESWDAFATFAESNLQATVHRDPAGKVLAVGGRYEWSAGDVPAREERSDTLPDAVARILGGTEKRLVIGDQPISFAPADNGTTSFSPFSSSAENCVGRHCIEGKSWVTHLAFYHSVGTRTRQTAGGTDLVARPCCTSGELVNEDGEWQCRGRRPGAWEYDRQAGRLVPTGPDPYVMTAAKSCQREVLRNRLQVRGTFVDRGKPVQDTLTARQANTREVEIGEWLIGLGLESRDFDVSDIQGVCAAHSSNRGELARTSQGNTGEDDSLCQ